MRQKAGRTSCRKPCATAAELQPQTHDECPVLRRLIRPGIVRAGYSAPLDPRTRRTLRPVARVGLPGAATSAQEPQAESSDQNKKRGSGSLLEGELGEDYWIESHFVTPAARRGV